MRLVTFHPPTPPLQVDELRKALQEQTQRVEDTTALRERMPKSPERAWAFRHRFWPWFQVDNPTTPPKSGQVPPKAGEVSIWPFLYILESKSRGVAKRCSLWLFLLADQFGGVLRRKATNSCCNMLQWHLQCLILVLQNRDLFFLHEK